MPFTFAHPAAVLPFRKLCPKYLNFAALVCGSIAPDFGYFIGQWNLSATAHTAAGSLYVDIPVGAAILATYYTCRASVAELLPKPHRLFWTTVPDCGHNIMRPQYLLIAAASVFIGAWTHICWDSFTHSHGWIVLAIPELSITILTTDKFAVPLYKLIQYGSSALGFLLIIFVYNRALGTTATTEDTSSESTKVVRLALMALLAIAVGVAFTLSNVSPQPEATKFQRSTVQIITLSITTFVIILLSTSLAARQLNKHKSSEG